MSDFFVIIDTKISATINLIADIFVFTNTFGVAGTSFPATKSKNVLPCAG